MRLKQLLTSMRIAPDFILYFGANCLVQEAEYYTDLFDDDGKSGHDGTFSNHWVHIVNDASGSPQWVIDWTGWQFGPRPLLAPYDEYVRQFVPGQSWHMKLPIGTALRGDEEEVEEEEEEEWVVDGGAYIWGRLRLFGGR